MLLMLLMLPLLLLLPSGPSLVLANDVLMADCNDVNHSILSLPVGQQRFRDSSGIVSTRQFYTNHKLS